MEEIIDEDIIKTLQKNNLFSSLSNKQLNDLIPLIRVIDVDANKLIIYENDNPIDLYIIWKGEVEVLKKAKDGTELRISTLQSGEAIGEMGLIDNSPRSASIRTIVPTKLLVFSIADLKNLTKNTLFYNQLISKLSDVINELQFYINEQPTYLTLISNLAGTLSSRIRQTNQLTVDTLRSDLEHTKARIAMGKFMIDVLLVVVIYMYTFSVLAKLAHSHQSTSIVSIPLIIFFGIIVLFMMKNSSYPLQFYGLTLNNWRRALWEGILWSIPLILLIVLIKWLVINLVPQFSHLKLINAVILTGHDMNPNHNLPSLIALVLAYLVFTPIQELIARGALQSSLQEFLIGPNRIWWAILMSNILFSVTHLHVSISLAIAVLIPGFFWGWLYYRHKTLIGVSISHLIVGGLAFFVFDIRSIFAF